MDQTGSSRGAAIRFAKWASALLALTYGTPAARADEAPALPHWARAPKQWSASGTLALGFSARSIASFGYGQPHWLWLGVDLRGSVASTFVAQSAGLRLVLPLAEVGLQARRLMPYERRFPTAHAHFDSQTLGSDAGGLDYRALEAWLTAYAPLFGALAYASVWVDRLSGVPAGHYVYDEITRAVVAAPWVGSEQLAYLLPVAERHYLGPFTEHVWSSRAAPGVWRTGIGYYARLGPHLSLLTYLTLPFASPDELGVGIGAGGNLALSYAWSSTDPEPGWP